MKASQKLEDVSLKTTQTKCPICDKTLIGEIIQNGKEIYLRRTCNIHGFQETRLSSDSRFYHLAKANSADACCASGCGPVQTKTKPENGLFDTLSTCVALIEIVDSCNLECPTCFASSLNFKGGDIKCKSFDEIVRLVSGVIEKKGRIEILQLSGGEPTIHPEFFKTLRWCLENKNIEYVLINTNGIRIAGNEAFRNELFELYKEFAGMQLYLQYDGPQKNGQIELRAGDFTPVRKQVLNFCENAKFPVTLAMTVTPLNIDFLWETIQVGLGYQYVRGVSFQPIFGSGRKNPKLFPKQDKPICVADIVNGIINQSSRQISEDDFTPLPCGDPNCHTIGWIFRIGNQIFSPTSQGIDLGALQSKLKDRLSYKLEDLIKCGCESTELGDLMHSLEATESNAFRLFIKPFMDSNTWDQDRIKRCCTHVIRPDGQLDSFCRYYANLGSC